MLMSMKKQRNLYFKYGTCTPDKEFREMKVDGVLKVMSVREAVKYRERRNKRMESQNEKIEECRRYNLQNKPPQINIPMLREEGSIEEMIAHINKLGSIR